MMDDGRLIQTAPGIHSFGRCVWVPTRLTVSVPFIIDEYLVRTAA